MLTGTLTRVEYRRTAKVSRLFYFPTLLKLFVSDLGIIEKLELRSTSQPELVQETGL